MKIKIVAGTSSEFSTKAQEVVDLYNELSGDPVKAKPNFIALENLFVAYPDGVKGGVIVNVFAPEFPNYGQIMFAAFEESEQGKGYLSATLKKLKPYLAKKSVQLVSVDLTEGLPSKIWKHLGFKHKGSINAHPQLLTKPMDQLFQGAEQLHPMVAMAKLARQNGVLPKGSMLEAALAIHETKRFGK